MVDFRAGPERLAGTLELPAGAGPFPGVLLLNGSGPLDRNSDMPGQALRITSSLAAALAEVGLASLRYDKRGVGESSGDYLTTGFVDEVDDARSALHALQGHAEVDGTRVLVAGHSVGATIAASLAATEPVAGCILLAGAVDDGATVMRRQSESIAGTMTGVGRLRRRRFLRTQDDVRRPHAQSAPDVIDVDGTPLPARWFREYMAHDPRADLAGVHCPVLAVTGANDIQVVPADVHQVGRLVGGPSTLWIAPGTTHLLRKGRPGLAHYARSMSRPVDHELISVVVRWAQGVVGR
jgi:pimeloyl-ACP methyl ester carboxylesterase